MTDPGRLIELPNGTQLYFVEDGHEYWRAKPDGSRGRRLTGVTTAIRPLDFDAERLLKWAARTNGEGIAILASDGLSLEDAEDMRSALGWLESAESIWDELERSELTFAHIRDQAATRGTNVHELALMALARGEPVPDFEGMTDEERGYAKGVVAFWLEEEPEPSAVEQVVCSPELGVAGRLDLLGEIKGKDGPGVIDAKTSFWTSERDHAQVAGYRYLAEECGIGASEWGAILKLSSQGTYELIDCEAEAPDFLAALDVYRRRGRIKSAAGKARKAREKAAA